MTQLISPKASLIILIGATPKPEQPLIELLARAKDQPNRPLTLGFPSSWLPRTRADEYPFPTIDQGILNELWELETRNILTLASTGFSYAPEKELPSSILQEHRSWIQKNPWTTNLWQPNQPPILLPWNPDHQRPWAENHRTKSWFLEGYIRQEGNLWAVFSNPDSDIHAVPASFLNPKTVSEIDPKTFFKDLKKLAVQEHLPGFTGSPESLTPIFITVCQTPEDISRIISLFDRIDAYTDPDEKFPKPSFMKRNPLTLVPLIETIQKAPQSPGVPAGLQDSLFPPGWGNHPWTNHAMNLQWQNTGFGQKKTLEKIGILGIEGSWEDIPMKNPALGVSRELIASMLGNANLIGETLEAVFHDGKFQGLVGTFGAATGSGIRVPAMEIENRRLHWSIESAFSFETDDSRGLRQIAVLSSDLFTLQGRILSDYVFLDSYPAMIVDIRIQHPWIEKNLMIQSYLPWIMNIWTLEKNREYTIERYLNDREYYRKTIHHPEKNTCESSKKLSGFFSRPSGEQERRYCLPGTHWDVPCHQGTLRIRRAESLLYPDALIPGVFITSPAEQNSGLAFCPTRNYSGIPGKSLQGIQEHFALLLYDPEHEMEILTSSKDLREKVFTPWVVRC